jgi:hypothetical protein
LNVNSSGAAACACCGSPAAWSEQPTHDELLTLATARSLEGCWDCRSCGETNPGDVEHRCVVCSVRRQGQRDAAGAIDLTDLDEPQAGGADGGASSAAEAAADDGGDDPELTLALAQSLEGAWDCGSCGETNPRDAGRCLHHTCRVYRHRSAGMAATAEASVDAATAAPGPPGAAARCGLPGCSSAPARAPAHGFCGEAHRLKAARKGLLAPQHPGVERVYVDQASGEWTAHLLTKRHPHRASVVGRFLSSWRKPHAETGRPRVQRVFFLRAPPGVYAKFRERSAQRGGVVSVRSVVPGCEYTREAMCGARR